MQEQDQVNAMNVSLVQVTRTNVSIAANEDIGLMTVVLEMVIDDMVAIEEEVTHVACHQEEQGIDVIEVIEMAEMVEMMVDQRS
jgi:hypothetical protein